MKDRTPHSWSDAVTRIAARIGWDGAARAVGRKDSLVRAWSDPATGKRPSLDQALALSVAYAEAGADDAPFVDAFAFQLDHRVSAATACRIALTGDAARASIEVGEAIAAALRLTQPGHSPRDALRAFAEGQQAEGAIDALLRRVASFLPADAGSSGTKNGDPQ